MTNNPSKNPTTKTEPSPEPQKSPSLSEQIPPGIPPQILAMLAAKGELPYTGGSVPVGILQQLQVWQGPYPPPEVIEKYEEKLPGFFERMVVMAEKLQTANIEGNKRAQDYLQADTKRGHYFAFIVSIAAMVGAIICLYLGSPWVAALFVSVDVMAVAKAFLASTKKENVSDPGQPLVSQKTQKPEAP